MNSPLSAEEIIESVVDSGSFVPGAQPQTCIDPLGWDLGAAYPDSLLATKAKTGLPAALCWGQATVGNRRAMLIVGAFEFMAGSLGLAEAAAIRRAIEVAIEQRLPVVWFACGGGCRMQEGALSLFCIASVVAARRALGEHHLPLITVVVNPLFGGAAIAALRGDIILGLTGTSLGLAGRHVVERMEKLPLPLGFQSPEFAHHNGQIDSVLDRAALPAALARLLRLLGEGDTTGTDAVFPAESEYDASAWELVTAARTKKPTSRSVVATIGEDFFELHGDRVAGDDRAIFGGITRIAGRPVMVVGHDTACGHDTLFKIAHNFNMVEASGHRKALRLVRLADRLRMPLLTLIDTPGASVGVRSESEGQALVMGELLDAMLGVSVPTVAVILGEGGSGGAVPLASADRLLMTDASYCSVLSPEAAALIVLQDAAQAPRAADALKLAPRDLKELGLVDRILPVADGGASFAGLLRDAFLACLQEVDGRPDVARRSRVGAQHL